jgi:hypothetical protein
MTGAAHTAMMRTAPPPPPRRGGDGPAGSSSSRQPPTTQQQQQRSYSKTEAAASAEGMLDLGEAGMGQMVTSIHTGATFTEIVHFLSHFRENVSHTVGVYSTEPRPN